MERHNSTRFQSPIAILALVPCDSPIDTTARNFVPSQKRVVVGRNCFFLLWKVNPEGFCEVSCLQKLNLRAADPSNVCYVLPRSLTEPHHFPVLRHETRVPHVSLPAAIDNSF